MASAFLSSSATALGTTEETFCRSGVGTVAAAGVARVDQSRTPSSGAHPIVLEQVVLGSKHYAVAKGHTIGVFGSWRTCEAHWTERILSRPCQPNPGGTQT